MFSTLNEVPPWFGQGHSGRFSLRDACGAPLGEVAEEEAAKLSPVVFPQSGEIIQNLLSGNVVKA